MPRPSVTAAPITALPVSKQLPPGSTIGIVGGGQLAKMTAIAAAQLGMSIILSLPFSLLAGYRVHIYCPDKHAPAFQVTPEKTVAEYTDEKSLQLFAAQVQVITYEFENIPLHGIEHLARFVPVHPSPAVLGICQVILSPPALH